MTDYLNIGSTPHDEPCASITDNMHYIEAKVFAKQIERAYPPVFGARVKVKWFDHDFGSYAEACIVYNDTNDEACDYAYHVESDPDNKLQKWDSEALAELEQAKQTERVD